MSIADGQVVLRRDADTGAVSVDPQASISRIGARAYPPALADLAVQLRFELAQVVPVCACLVFLVHSMHLHGPSLVPCGLCHSFIRLHGVTRCLVGVSSFDQVLQCADCARPQGGCQTENGSGGHAVLLYAAAPGGRISGRMRAWGGHTHVVICRLRMRGGLWAIPAMRQHGSRRCLQSKRRRPSLRHLGTRSPWRSRCGSRHSL